MILKYSFLILFFFIILQLSALSTNELNNSKDDNRNSVLDIVNINKNNISVINSANNNNLNNNGINNNSRNKIKIPIDKDNNKNQQVEPKVSNSHQSIDNNNKIDIINIKSQSTNFQSNNNLNSENQEILYDKIKEKDVNSNGLAKNQDDSSINLSNENSSNFEEVENHSKKSNSILNVKNEESKIDSGLGIQKDYNSKFEKKDTTSRDDIIDVSYESESINKDNDIPDDDGDIPDENIKPNNISNNNSQNNSGNKNKSSNSSNNKSNNSYTDMNNSNNNKIDNKINNNNVNNDSNSKTKSNQTLNDQDDITKNNNKVKKDTEIKKNLNNKNSNVHQAAQIEIDPYNQTCTLIVFGVGGLVCLVLVYIIYKRMKTPKSRHVYLNAPHYQMLEMDSLK